MQITIKICIPMNMNKLYSLSTPVILILLLDFVFVLSENWFLAFTIAISIYIYQQIYKSSCCWILKCIDFERWLCVHKCKNHKSITAQSFITFMSNRIWLCEEIKREEDKFIQRFLVLQQLLAWPHKRVSKVSCVFCNDFVFFFCGFSKFRLSASGVFQLSPWHIILHQLTWQTFATLCDNISGKFFTASIHANKIIRSYIYKSTYMHARCRLILCCTQ